MKVAELWGDYQYEPENSRSSAAPALGFTSDNKSAVDKIDKPSLTKPRSTNCQWAFMCLRKDSVIAVAGGLDLKEQRCSHN